jgi:uncharacterized protein YicC (UPF0701 family)
VPDHLTAGLDDLVNEFEKRRVRIALFGEVKAGKSTLLNAIAGSLLSPVAFDPLTSVPVRITYGPQTVWRVGEHRLANIDELERLMRDVQFTAPEVVVETPLDLLQLGGQVDLMDTPGVGSHVQFDAITDEALKSLDAIVLVVRYPALFTQFTRHLVERLRSDIGKLFVVWNLDAACAELRPDERQHHAETLKANVATTHELFLVDARGGLRAGSDSSVRADSGLAAFCEAIGRFVVSNQREIVALREAAKRSIAWLEAVHPSLLSRQADVEQIVRAAQERIDMVRARADKESDEIQAALRDHEDTVKKIAAQANDAAQRRVDTLRADLGAARRHWIRDGHLLKLERAVKDAVEKYATDMAVLARGARDQWVTAAAAYGSDVSLTARTRSEPVLQRLTTEDRNVRATSGSAKLFRRAIWKNWYLPGLATLEGEALNSNLSSHVTWVDNALRAVNAAGQEIAQQRVAKVTARADDEVAHIKIETNFDAFAAELQHLNEGIPGLTTQVGNVQELAKQARALM